MATNNMQVFNDDENDSIVPTGECKWTASTGFRPPSECFAPYVVRIARRASFPPNEPIQKFDLRSYEHRRPASRNLLKQIQEIYSNISEEEKNKIFENKANPPKRMKYNPSSMSYQGESFYQSFTDSQIESQIELQIQPKIQNLMNEK